MPAGAAVAQGGGEAGGGGGDDAGGRGASLAAGSVEGSLQQQRIHSRRWRSMVRDQELAEYNPHHGLQRTVGDRQRVW